MLALIPISLWCALAQDAENPPAPPPEPAPAPPPEPAAEPAPPPPPAAPAPAGQLPLAFASEAHPPPAAGEASAAAPLKPWRWAALPIANFSSTYGLGYGAYANIVYNGTEPLGDLPYKAKIAVQAYFTTGSYYDHYVKMDFPGIGGSKFRWDFQAGVTGWPTASWYGVGNNPPRYDITEPCNKEAQEHGLSSALAPVPCYYNYGQKASFKVITNLRREINGPVSGFVNAYVRNFNLNIYDNSLVDQTQPVGVDGGLYTRLGVGLMYDTRNQEPSPTGGMFSEASVRGGMNVSDPSQKVFAFNVTDRRWIGFGKKKKVVLASREIVDMKWGEEPFFMSQTIGGSEDLSVGTSVLLRGFSYARFTGDGAVFWTPELRWQFATIPIGSAKLELMTGPYFDVGRVWLWDPAAEGLDPEEGLNLHYSYGLGTRFIFNTNMVVRLDFGWSQDSVTNYVDPTQTLPDRNFGLYLVFDHPF